MSNISSSSSCKQSGSFSRKFNGKRGVFNDSYQQTLTDEEDSQESLQHCENTVNLVQKLTIQSVTDKLKGPYANHILIPQGSTGSSIFFDIK